MGQHDLGDSRTEATNHCIPSIRAPQDAYRKAACASAASASVACCAARRPQTSSLRPGRAARRADLEAFLT
eukprot:7385642-Prymnesium_polylepis.1